MRIAMYIACIVLQLEADTASQCDYLQEQMCSHIKSNIKRLMWSLIHFSIMSCLLVFLQSLNLGLIKRQRKLILSPVVEGVP